MNRHGLRLAVLPQAEVNARIAGGQIAASRAGIAALHAVRGLYRHDGSGAAARAAAADQPQAKPVALSRRPIVQKERGALGIHEERVEAAVVVYISRA